MVIMWVIFIIFSFLSLIWIITTDEKMSAIVVTAIFVVGFCWIMLGNVISVKNIKYNITNNVLIKRTTLKTYLSYNETLLELEDVKSYKFLTKENCNIFYEKKFNMYGGITSNEIIVTYHKNIK